MYDINTLRPRQNGHRFANDIFKRIFLNENVRISIKISLKFGLINNNPALVQIMTCASQATSHYLNQWWLIYWRIYASLGLNELARYYTLLTLAPYIHDMGTKWPFITLNIMRFEAKSIPKNKMAHIAFYSRWRHQMETFSAFNCPFGRGIHRSPVNYPYKGQWRGAWMFSFICAWTNVSVNNQDAGDSRRHRIHYDVSVMWPCVAIE